MADVDVNGQVTAKNVGTATITATTSNGLKSTCMVTVTEKSVAQSVIPDGYYEIRSAVSGKNLEVYGVSTLGGAKNHPVVRYRRKEPEMESRKPGRRKCPHYECKLRLGIGL